MWFEQIVFYATSAIIILASLMMVTSRNPVKSALFLVLCFFSSTVLWMLLEAEFLALVLIFVYVGAVMTLFMFVVMMLNIDIETLKQNFVKLLPVVLIVVAGMVGIMIYAIAPNHFGLLAPAHHGPDYSNTKAMGSVLYTQYAYPLELAAVILLVAMISAISLTHRAKIRRKTQDHRAQLSADSSRVRMVNMPSEKKK